MFGSHVPAETRDRGMQSPIAAFSRGEQRPGKQWRFSFPNGFGASVINDGYGADRGLYELGVLGPDGHLTYDTAITDDVLGFLTEDQVTENLDRIAALTLEGVEAEIARKANEARDARISELRAELAALEAGVSA